MYKLIIVDDEPTTCDVLSAFIKEENIGFEVMAVFGDGLQAWEYIQNYPVDCVITDIKMPHMSGLELANSIRHFKRAIMVLLLSGHTDFEYARQAIQYGVRDYLLKPIDFDDMSDKLKILKEQMDQDDRFVCDNSQDGIEREDSSNIIEAAEKYILEHYAERISREDVASACFLNPSYFGRYFKQKTGYTFIDYLTKVRMQKAVELLADGVSIEIISQKVGYTSTRHFVRTFKDEHGCTPREYRRIHL